MSAPWAAIGQIALLALALVLTVPPMARLLTHTYTSERHWRVERVTYRLLRLDPEADQTWRTYAISVLGFSVVGVLVLYAFGRLQQLLPLRRASRFGRQHLPHPRHPLAQPATQSQIHRPRIGLQHPSLVIQLKHRHIHSSQRHLSCGRRADRRALQSLLVPRRSVRLGQHAFIRR